MPRSALSSALKVPHPGKMPQAHKQGASDPLAEIKRPLVFLPNKAFPKDPSGNWGDRGQWWEELRNVFWVFDEQRRPEPGSRSFPTKLRSPAPSLLFYLHTKHGTCLPGRESRRSSRRPGSHPHFLSHKETIWKADTAGSGAGPSAGAQTSPPHCPCVALRPSPFPELRGRMEVTDICPLPFTCRDRPTPHISQQGPGPSIRLGASGARNTQARPGLWVCRVFAQGAGPLRAQSQKGLAQTHFHTGSDLRRGTNRTVGKRAQVHTYACKCMSAHVHTRGHHVSRYVHTHTHTDTTCPGMYTHTHTSMQTLHVQVCTHTCTETTRVQVCTHTRTQACRHHMSRYVYTHTHAWTTHVQVCTHTHAWTTHVQVCTHTCTQTTRVQVYTHTRTHGQHMSRYVHTHTRTDNTCPGYVHTHTHGQHMSKYVHTHARTTHVQVCTHTHARTTRVQVCTHTHTHGQHVSQVCTHTHARGQYVSRYVHTHTDNMCPGMYTHACMRTTRVQVCTHTRAQTTRVQVCTHRRACGQHMSRYAHTHTSARTTCVQGGGRVQRKAFGQSRRVQGETEMYHGGRKEDKREGGQENMHRKERRQDADRGSREGQSRVPGWGQGAGSSRPNQHRRV